MAKTRNSKSTASDACAAALRLLTGRDFSEAGLRKKLLQLGFSAENVEAACRYCHQYRYLDDQRYALERARQLMRSGRGIGRKILYDLRQRGIDEHTAAAALEQVGEEFDPLALLREQLQLRFPGFVYHQADEKLKRRVFSYFQRRGYRLDQLFTVLNDNDE